MIHYFLALLTTMLFSINKSTSNSYKSVNKSITKNTNILLNDPNKVILSDIAQQALDLVNYYRSTGCTCGKKYMPPVPAITYNMALEQAAQSHANDMANKNYYAHTSPQGTTLSHRITAQGYDWIAASENIASGQPTIQIVMQGWLNSPKHCENIMNFSYKEMGIARKNNLWTQVFGLTY